jgi:pilus assembly protein CpaF
MQEVNGMEGETITTSELFRFEREGIDEDGIIKGQLRATGIVPAFHKTLTSRGIDLPISVFGNGAW